ncbi:MAG: thioredoxin family protein, partial [candidate division KSB1 bacterium]|nr:thioredoxin family protein [candidate division KSB1 bacterium]
MGKELILNAIRGQKTERTPWLPFVGCHGGALVGVDAATYLRSAELIVRGVTEAIRLYRPDGVPVTFDLQVEAEALGCELQWAKENPPAVVSHVLEQRELSQLRVPEEGAGRIPTVLEATRQLAQAGHDVALFGLVTGPFTLALHLKGTAIFMEMYDRPEAVKELLQFTTQVAIRMASLYADAGCDVIALVDPMTSQISPETFREFVSPYATRVFETIRARGLLSSFFVCGHAQKNVEAMCQTGPDNICVDENIPLDFVKRTCQQYGVSFGGNMPLTTVLLMGSEDDCRRSAIQCMDVGGDTGYILAPGCDLPYGTPKANLVAVAEVVHDPYKRQVARELLAKQEEVTAAINLADYGRTDRVIVDIITLDSEACAPCQYMVEAVKAVAPHFGDLVLWREHKIKQRESVEFMMGLMVRNVPTICIDGQIKFVSIIPSQEELIRAIQERINEKLHMKLRERRGRLLVLGGGCERCEQVWANVQQAVRELGSTVEVERIMDEETIYSYGVSATPAIITVREQVRAAG